MLFFWSHLAMITSVLSRNSAPVHLEVTPMDDNGGYIVILTDILPNIVIDFKKNTDHIYENEIVLQFSSEGDYEPKLTHLDADDVPQNTEEVYVNELYFAAVRINKSGSGFVLTGIIGDMLINYSEHYNEHIYVSSSMHEPDGIKTAVAKFDRYTSLASPSLPIAQFRVLIILDAELVERLKKKYGNNNSLRAYLSTLFNAVNYRMKNVTGNSISVKISGVIAIQKSESFLKDVGYNGPLHDDDLLKAVEKWIGIHLDEINTNFNVVTFLTPSFSKYGDGECRGKASRRCGACLWRIPGPEKYLYKGVIVVEFRGTWGEVTVNTITHELLHLSGADDDQDESHSSYVMGPSKYTHDFSLSGEDIMRVRKFLESSEANCLKGMEKLVTPNIRKPNDTVAKLLPPPGRIVWRAKKLDA